MDPHAAGPKRVTSPEKKNNRRKMVAAIIAVLGMLILLLFIRYVLWPEREQMRNFSQLLHRVFNRADISQAHTAVPDSIAVPVVDSSSLESDNAAAARKTPAEGSAKTRAAGFKKNHPAAGTQAAGSLGGIAPPAPASNSQCQQTMLHRMETRQRRAVAHVRRGTDSHRSDNIAVVQGGGFLREKNGSP
jgi:hypothetical protein